MRLTRTGGRGKAFRMGLLGVCALGMGAARSGAENTEAAPERVSNAILFVGDGMGPAQVTAARIYKGDAANGHLTLDDLPRTAIVRTHSSDMAVTDSAAAATALATGVKSYNGAIGVDAAKQPIETILEKAKKAGKSVGVVTTTTITHATPACFYAHVPLRADESEIAAQLIAYGQVDVAFGGGRQFFTPKGTADEEDGTPGSRADGADLIARARETGYTVMRGRDDFDALTAKLDRNEDPGKVLGLFAGGMMAYELDRPADKWGEPSLAEMTRAAIRMLSRNPKGFFLMVEGGRIDHACHENRALHSVNDTLAFDDAVKTGMDLAPLDQTLILVTADHETGGLAINGYPPIGTKGEALFTQPPSMGPGDIITFASGPGANREPNNALPKTDPNYHQPSLVMKPMALHTGVDVHLWGVGAGSDVVHGTIQNTEIPKMMTRALGLNGEGV